MLTSEWSRSRFWLCHFLRNRHERPGVEWETPVEISPSLRPALLEFLGSELVQSEDDGRFLLAWASRQCAGDPAYVQSLRLFIREQQHRAKLLRRFLDRCGADPQRPQGAIARGFTAIRRPLGMRFELSYILLHRLADLPLYLAIHEASSDRTLRQVCDQIVADLRAHIAFHSERLTLEFAEFHSVRRNLRRARLRVMFAAALALAAKRHGRLLAATGMTRTQYLRAAWSLFQGLLERMVPYHRDALIAALGSQREHPYDKPNG